MQVTEFCEHKPVFFKECFFLLQAVPLSPEVSTFKNRFDVFRRALMNVTRSRQLAKNCSLELTSPVVVTVSCMRWIRERFCCERQLVRNLKELPGSMSRLNRFEVYSTCVASSYTCLDRVNKHVGKSLHLQVFEKAGQSLEQQH